MVTMGPGNRDPGGGRVVRMVLASGPGRLAISPGVESCRLPTDDRRKRVERGKAPVRAVGVVPEGKIGSARADFAALHKGLGAGPERVPVDAPAPPRA